VKLRALPLLILATAGCAAPYEDSPYYRPPSAARQKPVAGPPSAPETPAAAPVVPLPASGMKLTLAQCIEQALSSNRTLSIVRRQAAIARDQELETIAIALPQIKATGRYEIRNNDPGVNSPGGPVVFGDRENLTGKVDLLVPLYSFGRATGRFAAAGRIAEGAEFDAERSRQQVSMAVSSAYFTVLEAQKIRTVAEDSVAVVRQQVDISREFYQQGLVAQNDVLTAEVELSSREQDLIRARNNVLLARASLNRLLGRDTGEEIELEDVSETAPWNGSYEMLLDLALDKRPDLLALRKQVEAMQEQYKATRAEWFPYAYGFGAYNHTNDKNVLNPDWLSGGIAVEWPLFEGGLRMHQLARNRKEIESAVDRHNEKADDIVLEVKQAYLYLREAADRLPVARKASDIAAENLRIVRDQYSQGLVSSNDVLIQEERLSRARSNYYSSIYDYYNAYAALETAAGTPPSEVKP